MPASSCSSEHDFSQLKIAVRKHRSCLNVDMIENMAFLWSYLSQKGSLLFQLSRRSSSSLSKDMSIQYQVDLLFELKNSSFYFLVNFL